MPLELMNTTTTPTITVDAHEPLATHCGHDRPYYKPIILRPSAANIDNAMATGTMLLFARKLATATCSGGIAGRATTYDRLLLLPTSSMTMGS